VENIFDRELIARIRQSDEQAFYIFCNRHWKSLYFHLSSDMGDQEAALERVERLLRKLWDRRRELPELSTASITVLEYIVANGMEMAKRDPFNLHVFYLIQTAGLRIHKLLTSLGLVFRDKHLRYK